MVLHPPCVYSCFHEWSRLLWQGQIYYPCHLSDLPGCPMFCGMSSLLKSFMYSPNPIAYFLTLLSIPRITPPSIHSSICPLTHLSIYPSIYPSHPFIHSSICHPHTHPSTHPRINQPIFLSTYYPPGSALGSEDSV